MSFPNNARNVSSTLNSGKEIVSEGGGISYKSYIKYLLKNEGSVEKLIDLES